MRLRVCGKDQSCAVKAPSAAHSALNLEERESNAGLPVLGTFEDEVVERVANLGVLARVRIGEMVSHGVVLGVVLELLRRDGGAKEVLEVLEDILLGRRKRARLGVLIEG